MKTQKKSEILKRVFLFVVTVSSLVTGTSNASNVIPEKYIDDNVHAITATNPIFQELLNKLNGTEDCYLVDVSSMTVKKDGNLEQSFTTYGSFGYLKKKENVSAIKAFTVNTAFSDRSTFRGKKTIESFNISNRGSQVQVQITFKTWSNEVITLRNVKISKGRFGYFITGHYSKSNKSSYYTLAIYKTGCVI